MDQQLIFAPMLAMIWLTITVWVYLFSKRVPFIRSLGLTPNEITPQELLKRAPPHVATPSDNLKNLFEMPVLFYALALHIFAVEKVDLIYLITAWAFVLFRLGHSLIHCTFNDVMLRFKFYLASCVALIFIAARASFDLFS